MWFDDDLKGSGWLRSRRGNASRNAPVLMLNARLATPASEWGVRIAVVVLLFVCVAAGLYGAHAGVKAAGTAMFRGNSDYILTNLVVKCGSPALVDYVRNQMGVREGTNLFRVNIREMQSLLAATPNIKAATVRRILPSQLEVEVFERVPVARLGNVGDRVLRLVADEDGVVFLARSASIARGRPLITGYGAKKRSPGDCLWREIGDALRVLRVCEVSPVGAVVQVAAVDVNDKYLQLILSEGSKVLLPRWQEDDPEEQKVKDVEGRLKALAGAVSRYREAGVGLESVDLRRDDYENGYPATPRLQGR